MHVWMEYEFCVMGMPVQHGHRSAARVSGRGRTGVVYQLLPAVFSNQMRAGALMLQINGPVVLPEPVKGEIRKYCTGSNLAR